MARGRTFSFSTGDDGAGKCFALHTSSACRPATSACVVAVGGTRRASPPFAGVWARLVADKGGNLGALRSISAGP